MIILHHLNNSRSQRILWLLEELGIDYEIKPYTRNETTQLAPKSLFKVHPLGKSPVITDTHGKKEITIAESGAIIQYLCENYGKHLLPRKGSQAHRDCNYWMHFAEGSLMPQLLLKLIFDKIKTSPMPFFVRPIANKIANKVLDDYVLPNVTNNMAFIESHLSNHEWFAGDKLSAADFQMSFPLEAGMTRLDSSELPHISQFIKKIHSTESYQKALEKGGEYDYA